MSMLEPISSLNEIIWPAAPNPRAAAVLSMLYQLEHTQWYQESVIREKQFAQLRALVKHAVDTVPFYRERFDAAGLRWESIAQPENWQRLPLLTRRDVQDSASMLHSTRLPRSHGDKAMLMTSGSTGAPVVVAGTGVTQIMWQVLTLRDHLWHGRDFSAPFAAIRYVRSGGASYPDGERQENWGSATKDVTATGPGYLLSIKSTLEEQSNWLMRVNPTYLLSYPSVLEALARRLQSQSERPSNLREVRAFGEVMQPTCRAACEEAWGVPLTDLYSSQEVGYIALQCPQSDLYHIQSESVFVEVVNDQGMPAKLGEIGKVVVTALHNFAMPLLRYDIGDYAELGPPCPCGRGLPTLKRILGRQRNLLRLPNGTLRWPLFGEAAYEELPALRQFQVVQRSLDDIDVRVVTDYALTSDDVQRLRKYVQKTLEHEFNISVVRVPRIERHESGKFEDFLSEVTE